MLRSQLSIIAGFVLGGCAWSFSYQVELPNVSSIEQLSDKASAAELPDIVKRCFGDPPSEEGVAVTTEMSRDQAEALRRVLQKVEEGKSPTRAEYAAAGCTELDSP